MSQKFRPFATTLLAGICLSILGACVTSSDSVKQIADEPWEPAITHPTFLPGEGPQVWVDSAHGNFHTIGGRFEGFAKLLTADGYRVEDSAEGLTAEHLASKSVLVIANALSPLDEDWLLPADPAFSPQEVEALVGWVNNGGALLLIADHMPFPGSVADLAAAFGFVFLNGFVMKTPDGPGTLVFDVGSGSLTNHSIVRGQSEREAVESVMTFTGQAIRTVNPDAISLLTLPDDWIVLLPSEAWEFSSATPIVTTLGLVQGAIAQHGEGRIAVFGEAAMFTAQTQERDGTIRKFGLNHPDAAQNAQFVLNLMHWLSGELEYQGSP